MSISNPGRFRQQVRFLQWQFLQEGSLPFADVLSVQAIKPALTAIDFAWKDRVYTPLVTLWVFLGQVLSTDHSCRNAVARLIAHRLSQGLRACSSKTGAYCQARMRLPEKFFSAALQSEAGPRLSHRQDRGDHCAGHRSDHPSWVQPLRWQGARRSDAIA